MTHRLLHIANGTSTTRLIQAAGIPGRLSVWCDPLYEGPVPGGIDDGELLRVRARYLAGAEAESHASDALGLQGWRDVISDVASYDELVLWYEHDLFDQLNLVQLLSWIDARPRAPVVVSLIEIGSFPGHPAFMGLGELTPDDIRSLLDSRAAISEARYAMATRAWTAFRHSTPDMLDALRRSDTATAPFLGAALTRFLEEYPWVSDGLSRTERRLLEIAASGPVDLLTTFRRMHEGETAFYVTDLSLLAFLRGFSRCTPPLISVDAASLDMDRIPAGRLAITDQGRSILSGDLDRIATYGIDRWFGGVHLETGGVIWRWEDSSQRVVAEPRT
jgi:hypothetical protein